MASLNNVVVLLLLALSSVNVYATTPFKSNAATQFKSKYAGEESRTIKSLSADAIAQLKAGRGWGLAKAAELNGMPGPVHVLQMKKEIALTMEQEKKIQQLFNKMKSKAIPLGNKLIKLEKKLNDAFHNKTISKDSLSSQLQDIASVRMQLRYVHLETHLVTPAILTEEQVKKYNRLRGYAAGDPCSHVPAGHDAEMWKKHNDCQ